METTLQEQLDWLDEAREAGADLGLPGGMLALCSLPRTDQGKLSHFVRANCPFTLAMIAVGTVRLPCGKLPCLLAWACTEAVRTGRRDLVRGYSLRGFMGRLGVNNDGSVIADEAVFWWDYDRPGMDSLFPTEIRLSQPYFDSIVRQPIPMDLNCLHALRRPTLGLDLYPWLTCRTVSLTKPLPLDWNQVHVQHGPFPEKAGGSFTVQNFRKKATPGTEQDPAHLARAALPHRARTAHPPPHARADPPWAKTGRRRFSLASYVSTALLRLSQGDRWPSSLPKPLSRAILRSGLGLPPGARLPFEPLGRRKPAARTLDARPSGRLSLPCPCRHCAAPHSATLRPPRYRVWPLPPVPGERQTLTNP